MPRDRVQRDPAVLGVDLAHWYRKGGGADYGNHVPALAIWRVIPGLRRPGKAHRSIEWAHIGRDGIHDVFRSVKTFVEQAREPPHTKVWIPRYLLIHRPDVADVECHLIEAGRSQAELVGEGLGFVGFITFQTQLRDAELPFAAMKHMELVVGNEMGAEHGWPPSMHRARRLGGWRQGARAGLRNP